MTLYFSSIQFAFINFFEKLTKIAEVDYFVLQNSPKN